ncbi:winged helix-turn-helix transcriptional regulator [Aerococcaceae bacterium NML171108]|nr:winged helix-turn-helix transcriptional regulator [Aerococcaceae bacterium NML171108]
MKIIYSKHQSKLIELFTILQYTEGFSKNLDAHQVDLMQDLLDEINALSTYIAKRKENIQQLLLRSNVVSLDLAAYFYLLKKGHDPQNIVEYSDLILQLGEDDYLRILLRTFDSKATFINREQLYQLLETTDTIQEQRKWNWFKAIRNPRQHFEEMLPLLQETAEFYEPFYRKYADERDNFAKQFSLENSLDKFAFVDKNILTDLQIEQIILVPLSPWLAVFMLMGNEAYRELPFFLCIGTRIEQLFESKQLSDGALIEVLKNLSDISRYAVLKELTLPHAKTKDIAEKLDITSAAVSYHTQKLLSSGFLVASIDAQEVKAKYEINKELLRHIIAKLTADFKLDD